MGFNINGNFNSKDFKYVEGDETITNNINSNINENKDLENISDDLKQNIKLIINENNKSNDYKMNKIINELKENNQPDLIDIIINLGISGVKKFIL